MTTATASRTVHGLVLERIKQMEYDGYELEAAELKAWIRGGYYRFTSTYPVED